ncbi:flagellar biosynthesis protein FlgE [Ketobacter sp.]|nr:MAG: flagellar biosynthesis protein FlgE [Ketobacter sp.]
MRGSQNYPDEVNIMAIGSIMNNGVMGIQKGYSQINQATANIAKVAVSENPTRDLTESAVTMMQGKVQVEASAKVLQTASDTIGSLIDIQA